MIDGLDLLSICTIKVIPEDDGYHYPQADKFTDGELIWFGRGKKYVIKKNRTTKFNSCPECGLAGAVKENLGVNQVSCFDVHASCGTFCLVEVP